MIDCRAKIGDVFAIFWVPSDPCGSCVFYIVRYVKVNTPEPWRYYDNTINLICLEMNDDLLLG